MNYFWVLLGIPLLSLAYFAYVLIRMGGVRLPDCVTPLPPTNIETMRRMPDHPLSVR